MNTPSQQLASLYQSIKKPQKSAFFSALLLGLLIHLPIMLSDIPNHDGLASLYFDQNMITSGRWFLTIACGFSSYFTLPWVIGLLGLCFLGIGAAALVELLEVTDSLHIFLISGLLVSFPSLASTFAYVFTLDGYMLALALAILAVLLTKQGTEEGFSVKGLRAIIRGAVCLAFSMGTYQAYLPFAILLCLYEVLLLCLTNKSIKEKCLAALRYLAMGIFGLFLYYGILRLLLAIQGKELDTYQGINGLGALSAFSPATFLQMYQDFFTFLLNGNLFYNNLYSGIALGLLSLAALVVFLRLILQRKLYTKPLFYIVLLIAALSLPLCTNVILLLSPGVTYHLLMRYQYVLLLILLLAFSHKFMDPGKAAQFLPWVSVLAAAVLVFNYAITDNIGYSNLEKKYEKTYAYCLRLLDRIEQAEGYYQGIPIAMVGVIGDEAYPSTDLTKDLTAAMIGLSGDYLVYTGSNYAAFIENYLGATLNFLEPEAMAEIYYTEEYLNMGTFPAADSIKIIDGVLVIKTENSTRD